MEILNGHEGTVRFSVPSGVTSASFKVYRSGTQIGNAENAVIASGVASCLLPYAAVTADGQIRVELTFTQGGTVYTPSKIVEVATPVLEIFEIKEILETNDTAEAIALEAAVRHIINAFTGQTFNKYTGAFDVKGNDQLALDLPYRLISLTSVNGQTEFVNDYFSIEGDGHLLRHYPWGVPPVKADYYELHQHVGGVIHNPNNVRLGEFYKTMNYTIDGLWGWEFVPNAVREAAKLLVNDYACADSAYRDRYLASMTAADWRIQFASGAYTKTGNVRADQLLSDYVTTAGWVVV